MNCIDFCDGFYLLHNNVKLNQVTILSTLKKFYQESRPVGTKLILGGGGLNEVRAKRVKMGVRGLAPGKIFHDHAL